MRALGILAGTGTMLIGAKEQGWEILGNVEDRDYCQTKTFELNFPDSFFVQSLDEIPDDTIAKCYGVDLIVGHPPCGGFSNLRNNKMDRILKGDLGKIPDFVRAVQEFQPKFFVMDNLPKSLMLADWKYYSDNFPGYDIQFEWVSNWGYGNSQKGRTRLFVIGSLKELGYIFKPGEFEGYRTTLDVIKDIPAGTPNHVHLDRDKIYRGWRRMQFQPEYQTRSHDDNRLTLRELQGFIKDSPLNSNIEYTNKRGELKSKLGFARIGLDRPSRTLTGGGGCYDNLFREDTLMPFTVRERARIQGVPDWFQYDPDGIDHTCPEYQFLVRQTGRTVPVEFPRYITEQIRYFMQGKLDLDRANRIQKPDPLIDRNKFSYCMTIGYNNMKGRCNVCGSKNYCDQNKDLFS